MIEAATAMTESNEPMHSPDQLKLYPADPPSEHLIIALRLATAKAHEAIEQLPIMRRLTSQTVTRDDYRDYLLAMASVYTIVEKTLYEGMDDALRERLGLRPKLPALLLDLEELEEPWCSPGLGADDCGRDAGGFNPSGTSAVVGGLYTLEGATLGGRTIARQLRRTLGSGLGTARFLDFHGEHTATAWKRFSGVLDELCADGTVVPEEAINGALATFDYLHAALGQASAP
jgi:heme oxygenase